MSTIINLQQQRAAYALTHVQTALTGLNDDKQREYKSHAASFPAMILMNGLGQTAAFYKSKAGAQRQLYQLLSDWLTKAEQPYEKHNDLMTGLTQQGMEDYQVAQSEALLLLDWVKKFTKADIKKD